MKRGETFDDVARNLAEAIDDAISTTTRVRGRRIELIRHQVRHALRVGFKAGAASASKGVDNFCLRPPGRL